jgi:hypothetical protein
MNIRSGLYFPLLVVMFNFFAGCSEPEDDPFKIDNNKDYPEIGTIPQVTEPDVSITMRAKKISQLVGYVDREKEEPLQNQTFSRYGLQATDLGVPFQDGETTYILFGDSWGVVPGLPNVMAYTTDNNPEDGLALDFIEDDNGNFHPLLIPEISQHAFEVPTEGVMVNDKMYIYHTTDHNPPETTMGRSIVARSNDDGNKTFTQIYNLSTQYFINVSLVQVEASDWKYFPESEGAGHVIFGSSKYRESKVYMAYQPAAKIEDQRAIRYFKGVDETGLPLWSEYEKHSRPLFDMESSCVGEFSVSYNKFIKKWIMMYNCGNPRGINLRTADNPWGPWTKPQIIFHLWDDNGYCHFIHTNWEFDDCDDVHDPNRQNEWGGEYGPYQFEHFATGDENSTTIYFTLSTWNPYTVVLMKAKLQSSKVSALSF